MTASVAGYYKTNHRALRLREVARLNRRGWWNFPAVYLRTRFRAPSGGGAWMSDRWEDLAAEKDDLSPHFWTMTADCRRKVEALGFNCCGYRKGKSLDPDFLDSGGVIYLDRTRTNIARLFYVRMRDAEARISIRFTVVFADGSLTYSNRREFFDPLPGHEMVMIPSDDPAFVHRLFLKRLTKHPVQARKFVTMDSLKEWFDSVTQQAFAERVQRRVLIRMTDAEVEAARRRLAS